MTSADTLQYPTYVVLELPGHVARRVTQLRSRYDRYTAALPAEITIAGSSGVGPLSADQTAARVLEIVKNIGRVSLPFETSFAEISQFPDVPIFWLKPASREPFESIHEALVRAGLRFEPNRFAYNPHCTISNSVPLTAAQERALLSEAFPTERFSISCMSLYQFVSGDVVLWRSYDFGRNP